jgi:hypothetical protein
MYPDHLAEITALENVTGHTMFSKRVKGEVVTVSLEEKAGVKADPIKVQEHEAYLTERRATLLANKAIADAEKAEKKAMRALQGKGKKRVEHEDQPLLF